MVNHLITYSHGINKSDGARMFMVFVLKMTHKVWSTLVFKNDSNQTITFNVVVMDGQAVLLDKPLHG